jgi:ribosome-associated protein
MDIRKLQRAIVDGLEDVKGQNIVVFNTEHLSPLFERVIIASGTSNRQTKALAQSVRDAVKTGGMQVLRTEGEDNGEWIIVDCGAAVVHLMQPSIRDYYHLEEIWGDKPVKMKLDLSPVRLVKASEPDEVVKPKAKAAPRKAAAKAAPVRKAAPKTSAAKAAPARAKPAAGKPSLAKQVAAKQAPGKTVARKAPAKRTPVATKTVVTRTVGVKSAAAKAPAARKPAAKTATTKTIAAKKAPARKAPARS